MRLRFLGTRAASSEGFTDQHEESIATMLETSGKTIMLDVGPSWVVSTDPDAAQPGVLDDNNPGAIWISTEPNGSGLKGNAIRQPVYVTDDVSEEMPEDDYPLLNRRPANGGFRFPDGVAASAFRFDSGKGAAAALRIGTDIGPVGYIGSPFKEFPSGAQRNRFLKGLALYIGSAETMGQVEKQAKMLVEANVKRALFTGLSDEMIATGRRTIMVRLNEVAPELEVKVVIDGMETNLRKGESLLTAINIQGNPDKAPTEVIIDHAIVEAVHLKKKKKRKDRQYEGSHASVPSGAHDHPHGPDGDHSHLGLPDNTGGHQHDEPGGPIRFAGAHRHRPDDPLDGFHLGDAEDDGVHVHILALREQVPELWAWFEQVVAAHWPIHKWLPGHKETQIQHIGVEPELRPTTEEDWMTHCLWSMHSAGTSLQQHMAVFIAPETQFLRRVHIFDDGMQRDATAADFESEVKWFDENLPFPLEAMQELLGVSTYQEAVAALHEIVEGNRPAAPTEATVEGLDAAAWALALSHAATGAVAKASGSSAQSVWANVVTARMQERPIPRENLQQVAEWLAERGFILGAQEARKYNGKRKKAN